MITLCLDIGFRHTGWAVVIQYGSIPHAYGCIHTQRVCPSKMSQAQCDIKDCQYLSDQLVEIAQLHSVTQVLGETPSGAAQSSRAAACMGMAKATAGVALRNYPCTWVAPSETKGAARDKVLKYWPDFQPPKLAKDAEHVFDALSTYLTVIGVRA